MSRYRIALLGLVAACGGAPAKPAPAPAPPAPAPSPRIEIVAHQLAGGLRVSYRLPRPVESFRFLVAGPIRAESWHLLTPELQLAGDAVVPVRAGTFDRFEVLITPDHGEHDRVYPAMFAMGPRAFVVNTQYLLAVEPTPTAIELDAAAGDQVVSSFAPAGRVLRFEVDDRDKGHYVYLGEPPPTAGDAAVFIVAPSVPAWLRDRLHDVLGRGVPLYADKLGRPLATRPFVVVAYNDVDDDGRSYHGDTVAHGEIALRFRGKGWARGDADDDATEAVFLLHELAHLWNAELARPPHEGHLAWLHEGSAEYLALRAARELGVLTEASLDAQLAHAINGCVDALGAGSLVDASAPVRRGFYTCGVFVQWLAELSVKPQADSFAIWKALIAAPAYSVDAFRAEVKQRARGTELMDFVFTPARDWARLPQLVAAHGVTLAPASGPAWDGRRRAQLVSHLLAESCTGPHGFYSFADHVKLDSGDRCGALSGDPDVSFVDGHDLYAALDAAYRAVATKCARAGTVELRARDGHAVTARCAHPLPALAPWFALTAP